MRLWTNRGMDNGSIHCMGNGRLAVYGQGPNITQVFGPPYSAHSFISFRVDEYGEEIKVQSERITGTAIWVHTLYKDGNCIGEMTDFVDSELPCLIRNFRLQEPLRFTLQCQKSAKVMEKVGEQGGKVTSTGFLIYSEAGAFFYNRYPSPERLYFEVLSQGNARWDPYCEETGRTILCEAGESTIYFVGGPSYPQCIDNTEKITGISREAALLRTKAYWHDFTSGRYYYASHISQNAPDREKLLQCIDSIAVLVKTQQSIEGAVLAGHNYHLGYVRDQYGVSRCLLKLGYFEEAKAILSFYWNIWKRHGRIHNAQAAGFDGVFHVHENDAVEITGYLIIQAFDLYEKTGEETFLEEIFPMLEWAWEMQEEQLAGWMLPFNGDETYIAGGILPRNTLYHGSAEATLLFVTGGERLLDWVEFKDAWPKTRLAHGRELLGQVKAHYRENFWENGRLAANNPDRMRYAKLPRFRHGVCEACGDCMVWTERNKAGRYVCPSCLNDAKAQAVPEEKFYLQSVSLVPLYIGSSLFTKQEILKLLDDIIKLYRETGRLPSRPNGIRSVGYDYGMLLYNLTEYGKPEAQEIYEQMMAVLDETWAWVEYYDDGKPTGTRCRPWESGINLEAAINYIVQVAGIHLSGQGV